jgi:hypothetical protein
VDFSRFADETVPGKKEMPVLFESVGCGEALSLRESVGCGEASDLIVRGAVIVVC